MPHPNEMVERGLSDLEYLGDGVYVGNNEYHVVLFLLSPGSFGPDAIALEPNIIERLNSYLRRNEKPL